MDNEKVRQFLENLDYGPAPESDAKARAWLNQHGRLFTHYIDGRWQVSNGEFLNVLNPATAEVLAKVANGTSEDVDSAMKAAKRAFPDWRDTGGHERAAYLYAIARSLAKHARLFAVLESLNNGKTIRETRDIDIPLVIRHFYYFAGWAEIHENEYPDLVPGGVVAQIIPWNFPLLMLAWKIAPAIAVGNTVVLKPAEFTPLTALLFADLVLGEAKLPPGVVNIVTGDGSTGERMVRHKTPWKIAFTGSTEVGRKIREATAGTGKHLTLELGGKSPFVVFADADLDSVVEGVVDAIWFNQGQVCCAGSRLLAEESVYEELIRRIKVRMEKLRGGSPLDKAMDIGAVNSAMQLEKIERLVTQGKAEGAECFQPKNWSCPTDGYYFPPTLFTNVSSSNTIAQEEIFGPVLVCMSFRTPSEAIELANNTRYGLAASLWSQDIDKAIHVARRIKAGTVWINSTNLFDAASGFGGYRESGYGREGGRESIFEVLKDRKNRKQPSKPCLEVQLPNMEANHVFKKINRTYRFLIGGKLVRPDGAGSFEIRNPQGRLLGALGEANRKDVRNAVEAARNAFEAWSQESPHLRAQIIYFLAENLSAQKERFIQTLAKESNASEDIAEREVELSIQRLFRYAALADKFEGTVQPVPGRMLVTALKEPIGVVGVRAPDESSLLGLVSVLAPLIVMGNTVVLVAGRRALSAMEFIQVLQNSDIPAGVLNILSSSDPDSIAKILAEHEDVDAVWCFGTSEGCKAVEAASVSNMKRTWVSHGRPTNWEGREGESLRFLREATQVKNIWIPHGV